MSATCGSCRFWPTIPAAGFRPCARIPHDKRYPSLAEDDDSLLGYALEDMDTDAEREAYRAERARTKAVAVDGSGYFAALKTREDFGCILWEARP